MFNEISNQMIESLDSVDQKRFNYIKESIEQSSPVSPLLIRYFSDLAFSLAKQSLRNGKSIEIAEPLENIFENYINSTTGTEPNARINYLISETKLDFLYACGNHEISSLRLSPYIMVKNNQPPKN